MHTANVQAPYGPLQGAREVRVSRFVPLLWAALLLWASIGWGLAALGLGRLTGWW